MATQEKYGSHLLKLANWLAKRDITRLEQVSRVLAREWGAELYEYKSPRTGRCWSPATIKQAVCAARSFFKWCLVEDLIQDIVANALKIPKVENSTQRTLDITEAQQVLKACCDDTVAGIRNRALISLMLDSGLRSSEICRVQMDDLRFRMLLVDPMSGGLVEINFLTVLRKGGQKKSAYFGLETRQYLERWLEIRRNVAKTGVNELFVSLGGIKPGTGLTRDGLRVIIRKLAQHARVTHFSPHALRRSFACFLDAAGASSRKIQIFGGWSSIREVETYTRGIQIGSQYVQYSPVSFLIRINGIINQ